MPRFTELCCTPCMAPSTACTQARGLLAYRCCYETAPACAHRKPETTCNGERLDALVQGRCRSSTPAPRTSPQCSKHMLSQNPGGREAKSRAPPLKYSATSTGMDVQSTSWTNKCAATPHGRSLVTARHGRLALRSTQQQRHTPLLPEHKLFLELQLDLYRLVYAKPATTCIHARTRIFRAALITQCTAHCAPTPMPGLLEAHGYYLRARQNTVSVIPASPWHHAGPRSTGISLKSDVILQPASACQRSTAGACTTERNVLTRRHACIGLPHRLQAVRTARRARSARRRRRRARWSGWPRGAARPRAGAARAGPHRRRPHARASSSPAPAARARPPAPARCRTSRPSARVRSPPPARPPRTPALGSIYPSFTLTPHAEMCRCQNVSLCARLSPAPATAPAAAPPPLGARTAR
jgi:hypothetical protein